MVRKIKKLLMDFSNEFLDDKKIVTIGQEDSEKDKKIYYVSRLMGENRHGKKFRITKKKFLSMQENANTIQTIKVY